MAKGKLGKNTANNSTTIKGRKSQIASQIESPNKGCRSKTQTTARATVTNGEKINRRKRPQETDETSNKKFRCKIRSSTPELSCKEANKEFAEQVTDEKIRQINLSKNSKTNHSKTGLEADKSSSTNVSTSPNSEETRVEIHQRQIGDIMDDGIEVSINEQEFEPDYEDNQVKSKYEEDEVEDINLQEVLESSGMDELNELRTNEPETMDKLVILSKRTVADSEVSFTVTDQAALMQIPGLSEMVTQIVEAQVEARGEAKVNE